MDAERRLTLVVALCTAVLAFILLRRRSSAPGAAPGATTTTTTTTQTDVLLEGSEVTTTENQTNSTSNTSILNTSIQTAPAARSLPLESFKYEETTIGRRVVVPLRAGKRGLVYGMFGHSEIADQSLIFWAGETALTPRFVNMAKGGILAPWPSQVLRDTEPIFRLPPGVALELEQTKAGSVSIQFKARYDA